MQKQILKEAPREKKWCLNRTITSTVDIFRVILFFAVSLYPEVAEGSFFAVSGVLHPAVLVFLQRDTTAHNATYQMPIIMPFFVPCVRARARRRYNISHPSGRGIFSPSIEEEGQSSSVHIVYIDYTGTKNASCKDEYRPEIRRTHG